jgi:hypothetical protein
MALQKLLKDAFWNLELLKLSQLRVNRMHYVDL